MPSKANTNTVDAQPTATNNSGSGRNSVDSGNEVQALPQQILAIVQHKWRNLEKRKKKLDEYKKMGEASLKTDQRQALNHFDEVVLLLDMLSDMKKQFEATFVEHEALVRKQTKSEKIAQRKRDLERTREILEIRSVLNCLRDDSTRTKAKELLSEAELNAVDKFAESVEPCFEKGTAFIATATDCFERALRREDKPFFEKVTYHQLRLALSKLVEAVVESNVTAQEQPVVAQEPANDTKPCDQEDSTEKTESGEANNNEKDDPKQQKLEEIVKPGSFSFLQESQISAANNRNSQPPNYIPNENDEQIGAWVPQETSNTAPSEHVKDRDRANQNYQGNRNRGDRGHYQHRNNQHQRNNRRPYQHSGGADENNEAAAGGWPNDDADFSEWKETGSNLNRGGQDNRRRSGGRGRGYFRGGGQHGEKRNFNRGPKGGNPNPQQSKPAQSGGSLGQTYAV